jgi:hypothetical protein
LSFGAERILNGTLITGKKRVSSNFCYVTNKKTNSLKATVLHPSLISILGLFFIYFNNDT